MRRVLLAVAVSAALMSSAHAADKDGRFAVKGAGITNCERYMAEWKERGNLFYAYGGWIEGYLTAVNQFEDDTYDIVPWQNTGLLTTLIANHCNQNPDTPFLTAVRAMVQALADKRLTQQSEMVIARHGDQGVRMYQATLREVQTVLKERGFYKGGVDGLFGEGTRTALEAYQEAEGLEKSGMPDQRTLLQMLSQPAR